MIAKTHVQNLDVEVAEGKIVGIAMDIKLFPHLEGHATMLSEFLGGPVDVAVTSKDNIINLTMTPAVAKDDPPAEGQSEDGPGETDASSQPETTKTRRHRRASSRQSIQ